MSKYNIKYRTFDQLLASVKGDFEAYNLEDLIKPHQLIKVAKRVNKDLGLRISQTKNIVLEIDKGKVKLPDDFNILNYSYMLGKFETTQAVPQGTHVEEVPIDAPTYQPGTKTIDVCATPDPCPTPEPECPDPCQSPEPCGCKACGCNTWMNCKGQEMHFKNGSLYLNYQGMMEDGEGNLLVLDHDLINEYYEYAFKERIIEILMGNNETVNVGFAKLIMQKYRDARILANGIVNTPDFDELKEVHDMNRNAMYNKYYKMFS